MSDTPDPGSDKAINQGCSCPILDNRHGQGYLGTDEFVIGLDCPLHGDTDG
jgi:hypothetical protein